MVETERRADRDNPLAGLQRIGITHAHGRQVLAIDLQQRHVVLLVAAHHLGVELTAVAQLDLHVAGIGHHVVVGQHIAIGRNDEARAHAAALDAGATVRAARALPRHREVRAEEATEELRHVVVTAHRAPRSLAVGADNGGVDVDHTRPDLFNKVGEIGQAGNQRLCRCPWRGGWSSLGRGGRSRCLRAGHQRQGQGQQAHGLRAESGSHRTATSGSDGKRNTGPADGGA